LIVMGWGGLVILYVGFKELYFTAVRVQVSRRYLSASHQSTLFVPQRHTPESRLCPQSSKPEELPLQLLTEPYVTVSRHTALIVQPFKVSFLDSNVQTYSDYSQTLSATILLPCSISFSDFYICSSPI